MADLNNLKKERTLRKTKFTRLNNSIINNIETLSQTLLHSKFEELKSVWNDLQEKHDEYSLALKDTQEDGDEAYIEACQKTFEETEVKVDKAMNAGPTETVENEEGTQESEEKKRIELSNACKALKIEIENKHSVFKQANEDLQTLLTTEGDAEHVATAVKSAIARLQSNSSNSAYGATKKFQ